MMEPSTTKINKDRSFIMEIDTKLIVHDIQGTPIEMYAAYLTKSGNRVISGKKGTFWTNYEGHAFMRIPKFYVGMPTIHEIRRVFWYGKAPVASYLLEPDKLHPANAWLYVCTDQEYSLDKLSPPVRRNVRRGLKELTIEPITLEHLLAYGAQAFCDTRSRSGLNDGTPEAFRNCILSYSAFDGRKFLGAWKGEVLAAFLTIMEIDDWVELGCYSANEMLQYRPNDTLMYKALYYYLREQKFSMVSYGLSSIQSKSNAAGLHRFKMNVGFEARPVHRAFIPHPLLRLFINRLTLWCINALLRFKPTDRLLKKAEGTLKYMLGGTCMP